jgi:hypothetical protein
MPRVRHRRFRGVTPPVEQKKRYEYDEPDNTLPGDGDDQGENEHGGGKPPKAATHTTKTAKGK